MKRTVLWSLVLGVAAAAVAAPTALAEPRGPGNIDPVIANDVRPGTASPDDRPFARATSTHQTGSLAPDDRPLSRAAETASTSRPAAASPDSFHWGDAGVGAATTLVLLLLVGSTVGVRHQRRRVATS